MNIRPKTRTRLESKNGKGKVKRKCCLQAGCEHAWAHVGLRLNGSALTWASCPLIINRPQRHVIRLFPHSCNVSEGHYVHSLQQRTSAVCLGVIYHTKLRATKLIIAWRLLSKTEHGVFIQWLAHHRLLRGFPSYNAHYIQFDAYTLLALFGCFFKLFLAIAANPEQVLNEDHGITLSCSWWRIQFPWASSLSMAQQSRQILGNDGKIAFEHYIGEINRPFCWYSCGYVGVFCLQPFGERVTYRPLRRI